MNLHAAAARDDLNEVEQFQLARLGIKIHERRPAGRWVGRSFEAAATGAEPALTCTQVCVELLPSRVDDPAERNLRRIDRAVDVAGKGRTRLGLRREESPRAFGVRGLNTKTDQLVPRLALARNRRRVAALGIL